MDGWIMANEPWVRFGAFAGILVILMFWEQAGPLRGRAAPVLSRRFINLAFVALNTGAVRLLFLAMSVGAVGVAVIASERGWGLFGMLDWPVWLEGLIAILVLDLVIYGQHVAFHHVPVLWRLHRMHHADLDLDMTTGLRFHPLEIVLSMGLKILAILALGAPAIAVVVFEIVLNATSMFNHSNIKLPLMLERLLRLVVVTPHMHWVHHSIHRDETDSNFGFNLPWWDRLFRTYRQAPRDGYPDMVLGLPVYRDAPDQRLLHLLFNPFRGAAS